MMFNMYDVHVVCVPVHMHIQFDRCWTTTVMHVNAYLTALPILEGSINYWQGTIVKCMMPAMGGSVTKACSHDEGTHVCIRLEEVKQESKRV